MGRFNYISMALASIINFFMPVSMVVNPSCDFYQDMVMGKKYYIYSQGYPSNYRPSTACRWTAHSEVGTKIIISCEEVVIPRSSSCSGDRLAVSLSGNENFTDSKNYCGTGTFSHVSEANSLTVGLFSTSLSEGGRFVCTLTAIQDDSGGSTTESPPNVCDCGWKHESRIVGGVDSGVNEFTPMAGLVDVGQRLVYCGATIISNRYVITAAHCVEAAGTKDLNNVGILVGDHDVSTGGDTPAAALYRIQSYDIHPQYESKTYQNDLAILRTTGAMNFSIYVGPACLPFRYSTFDFQGVTVTALGWGLKEFSGPTSDILQKVNLTVEPSNECMTQYPDRVTANQICTYAPGKDSCQSDSGGPLFWFDPSSRRLQILGVISFGLGCATEKPSVNTRVTSYLSWIVSKTTDATYCIK